MYFLALFSTSFNEWYPRGIQISLHIRYPGFQALGGGGYSLPSQNSKCQDLPKFQFSGGGGTLCQVKTQSAKICLNFNFQGEGEGGTLGISNQNLLFSQKPACASQIVSHILRMWRLNDAKCYLIRCSLWLPDFIFLVISGC